MTTDRAQIATLQLDRHRQTLNAFIESIGPDVAREHDDDAFTIPLPYDLQIHLWAESTSIQVRGKTCGGSLIQPTSPPVLNLPLMDRCCSIVADYLSQTAGVELERFPAWCRDGVARELAKRAEALASLAGTSRTLSLGDALAVVEDELQRRDEVSPQFVLERLLEAGMPCQWVKAQEPTQWASRADDVGLGEALVRAGYTPHVRFTMADEDGYSVLEVGGEVIRAGSDNVVLYTLHTFLLRPRPSALNVLLALLPRVHAKNILGDGPVAAWCRAHAGK